MQLFLSFFARFLFFGDDKMDKFGIFNLLSSFLGQSFRSSGENPADYSYSAPPAFPDKSETAAAEKRATLPPLQNSMLKVMQSHNEFVKRVREKHKK